MIANNKAVSVYFTLKNRVGKIINSTENGSPIMYLHGRGEILPALEHILVGKSIGDKLKITLTPEEAYGIYDDSLIHVLNRNNFDKNKEIHIGMETIVKLPQGYQRVTIVKINKDKITVDGNHPLAGETLFYEVEIADIREPTDDELLHEHSQ